jgi:hypothetical protein
MSAAQGKGFLATAWAASAGLILGAPAAALNQQVLADTLYYDCRAGGPGMGLGVSLICAVAAVAGAAVSWRARAAAARDEAPQARRFLAEVSAGSAGLFLFAILAMALASVLVPSCHR